MNNTYIIAEACVNHNGSIDRAYKMIDAAVAAGVDAIKFQAFTSEKLVNKSAVKANYQLRYTSSEESQLDMLKKLELNHETHIKLLAYTKQKNIDFLCTPFDLDNIDFLTHELKIPILKIGSGEITNLPFLLKAAQTNCEIILSTGLASLGEVETSLAALAYGYLQIEDPPTLSRINNVFRSQQAQDVLRKNVTLLHCTTQYPTPFEAVNLMAMNTLRSAFGLRVGYSDHSLGISVPIAAAALGAVMIEKHFTLDKTLPGPDHQASLEPAELTEMVKSIRQVNLALGDGRKVMADSEQENCDVARRSMFAANNIKKGEAFTMSNVAILRPGNGVSPIYYWDSLGKIADRDYEAGMSIII
jgi:N-acetylneuraminate synthase